MSVSRSLTVQPLTSHLTPGASITAAQALVRSEIPITMHTHPLCPDLQETAAPTSLHLNSTLELLHETGLWISKVMRDKQALCNELQLSCESKLDRHAHAFAQSLTVPLPHGQLPGPISEAPCRFSGAGTSAPRGFPPGHSAARGNEPGPRGLHPVPPLC